MSGTRTRHHPGDGDLVRLLDGELDSPAAAELRRHLDGCDDCARRLRRVERQSRAIGGLIDASAAAMDPPAPSAPVRGVPADPGDRPGPGPGPGDGAPGARGRRPARSRGWRAAAAVALLLGAGLLAPPVRAWVAERVDAVRTRLGSETEEPVTATGATLLRLPAPDAVMTVETSRIGAGSVLVVGRVAGEEAVLEVTAPNAAVVVIEGGFRLEGGGPGAEYRLTVPGTVERVTLRWTGEPGRTVIVPVSGEARIPLGRRE